MWLVLLLERSNLTWYNIESIFFLDFIILFQEKKFPNDKLEQHHSSVVSRLLNKKWKSGEKLRDLLTSTLTLPGKFEWELTESILGKSAYGTSVSSSPWPRRRTGISQLQDTISSICPEFNLGCKVFLPSSSRFFYWVLGIPMGLVGGLLKGFWHATLLKYCSPKFFFNSYGSWRNRWLHSTPQNQDIPVNLLSRSF